MSAQCTAPTTPSHDTNASKEVEEEWSKDRAASVFTAAVLSGFTLVLAASYWLTRTSEYGMSPKPLYIWEIILFLSAILSMVVFICLRKNTAYVVDTDKPFSDAYMDTLFDTKEDGLPFWTYIRLRDIALTVCCVGCCILPFLEVYRFVNNLECIDDMFETFRNIECASNICRAIFCICQLLFLLWNKTKSAKNGLLRLLLSAVAVANFTLCVDVFMYAIQAYDTIDIQNKQNATFNISAIDPHEPVFIECQNSSVKMMMKIDINAEWIYKFTYQFPIEFAVFSLCYFGTIWSVYKPSKIKVSTDPQEHERENDNTRPESTVIDISGLESEPRQRETLATSADQNSLRRAHKYRYIITVVVKGIIKFTSTKAFPLSLVFVLGVFVFILYMEISYMDSHGGNKTLVYDYLNTTLTTLQESYMVTQTVYIYIICIVAPVGFILARRETIAHKRLNASDKLLLVGATGHLVFILVETVGYTDVINSGRKDFVVVIFYIKLLLKYQGVFAEAMIVLIASKMEVRLDSITNGRQSVIKGIIIFLGMFNTERWFTVNFLPPNILRYVAFTGYKEMYGQTTWWILTSFLYPCVVIFRQAMSIMCFETFVRVKREYVRLKRESRILWWWCDFFIFCLRLSNHVAHMFRDTVDVTSYRASRRRVQTLNIRITGPWFIPPYIPLFIW